MYKSEMASAKKDVSKCKRPKRSKKGAKKGTLKARNKAGQIYEKGTFSRNIDWEERLDGRTDKKEYGKLLIGDDESWCLERVIGARKYTKGSGAGY